MEFSLLSALCYGASVGFVQICDTENGALAFGVSYLSNMQATTSMLHVVHQIGFPVSGVIFASVGISSFATLFPPVKCSSGKGLKWYHEYG